MRCSLKELLICPIFVQMEVPLNAACKFFLSDTLDNLFIFLVMVNLNNTFFFPPNKNVYSESSLALLVIDFFSINKLMLKELKVFFSPHSTIDEHESTIDEHEFLPIQL